MDAPPSFWLVSRGVQIFICMVVMVWVQQINYSEICVVGHVLYVTFEHLANSRKGDYYDGLGANIRQKSPQGCVVLISNSQRGTRFFFVNGYPPRSSGGIAG
jgi:hypothetical protein